MRTECFKWRSFAWSCFEDKLSFNFRCMHSLIHHTQEIGRYLCCLIRSRTPLLTTSQARSFVCSTLNSMNFVQPMNRRVLTSIQRNWDQTLTELMNGSIGKSLVFFSSWRIYCYWISSVHWMNTIMVILETSTMACIEVVLRHHKKLMTQLLKSYFKVLIR